MEKALADISDTSISTKNVEAEARSESGGSAKFSWKRKRQKGTASAYISTFISNVKNLNVVQFLENILRKVNV